MVGSSVEWVRGYECWVVLPSLVHVNTKELSLSLAYDVAFLILLALLPVTNVWAPV